MSRAAAASPVDSRSWNSTAVDFVRVDVRHAEIRVRVAVDAATQREHEAATRVKNIHKIVLGRWEMQTWYYSPFPKGYADCDTLYFCEFDLHFVKRREVEMDIEP